MNLPDPYSKSRIATLAAVQVAARDNRTKSEEDMQGGPSRPRPVSPGNKLDQRGFGLRVLGLLEHGLRDANLQ